MDESLRSSSEMSSTPPPPPLHRSLLPQEEIAGISAQPSSSGVIDDNVQLKNFCLSPKDMENKENMCQIGEETDAFSISKETPALGKSNRRKRGGFNMRKSLAWNQAFFTEEGVLDPMELFTLAGPSTRTNVVSPLMSHQKSGNRPALDVVGMKNFSKKYATCKGSRGNPLFKLKGSSVQEEQQESVASRTTPTAKRTMKSVPHPTTPHSQKRVANTNATNPTSKIPKFTTTKPRIPSLLASPKEVCLTPKMSPLNKTTAKVNSGKNLGGQGFKSVMKNQSGTSTSFGRPATDHSRLKASKAEKDITGFRSIPYSSSPRVAHERMISSTHTKEASTNQQDAYHVQESATAPTQAKPSALRMPSPSLGFFHQGRLPRTCSSSQPSAPYLNNSASNQRKVGIWSASSGQRPPKAPVALKVCVEAIDCASRQNSSTTSCSLSSIPSIIYPSINKDVAVLQVDKISNDVTNRESIKSYSLTVCDNIDGQPTSSSRSLEPSVLKETSYRSSYKPQGKYGYLVEETIPNENILKANFPEGLQNSLSTEACELTEGASGNLLSSNSNMNLAGSELHEQLSPLEYPTKHSEKGKTISKIPDCSGKHKDSATDSNLSFHAEYSLPAMTGMPTVLPLIKSLPESDKENITCFDYKSKLGVHSSEQKIGSTFQNKILENSCLAVKLSGNSMEDKIPASEKNGFQTCGEWLDNSEQSNSIRVQELVANKEEQNDKKKPDIVLPKHHLNVVPFSDEWLAEMEAFGEEILERKTGAVQNSPTEKTVPEPGPWSPVRKIQEVGPFDCTKYSRNPSDPDS